MTVLLKQECCAVPSTEGTLLSPKIISTNERYIGGGERCCIEAVAPCRDTHSWKTVYAHVRAIVSVYVHLSTCQGFAQEHPTGVEMVIKH